MKLTQFGKRGECHDSARKPIDRAPKVESPALTAVEPQAIPSDAPPARILVIEDEPLIAMDIVTILEEELGQQVIGVSRTRSEASDLFSREIPQLIISDIQLADGSSGIDAVNDLLRRHPLPVIFIPAFIASLTADVRPNPMITISKPFRAETVAAAINQALTLDLTARPGIGRCNGESWQSGATA